MPSALVLAGRILLLAGEQLLVKRLAERATGELAAAFLFFAWATVALLPFAVAVAGGWIPAGAGGGHAWAALPDRLPDLLAAGLVYTAAFVLYVAGLARGELSRVAPLHGVSQMALLVLAVGFTGERISLGRVAGMALMTLGTAALTRPGRAVGGPSLEPEEERWAAWATVGYGVLVAAARVIDREAAAGMNPVLYAATVDAQVTFWTGVAVLLEQGGGGLLRLLRRCDWVTVGAGAANAGSYLFLVALLPRLPLTVLEPASALAALVAALAGVLWGGESWRGKLLPACLMLAGSCFLAMER
ncbi:MAG: EamA family transporter [Bacillota bacterium]|nr:EamA family transporter [Bacillota bacterium]